MSTAAAGSKKKRTLQVVDNDSDTAESPQPQATPTKKQKQSEQAESTPVKSVALEQKNLSSTVRTDLVKSSVSGASSSTTVEQTAGVEISADPGLEQPEKAFLFDLDSPPKLVTSNKFRPYGYIEKTPDSINMLEVRLAQTM